MQVIKGIILLLIFASASLIGILLSGNYRNRVNELKEIKTSFAILKTKMRYTYEPIPEIFRQIGENTKETVSYIFREASNKMETMSAGQAWIEALDHSHTNLTEEDLGILREFHKLLGQTDVEGQVSQIEMIDTFLDTQITKAEKEREKNEKLYKTLGMVTGITIIIILI